MSTWSSLGWASLEILRLKGGTLEEAWAELSDDIVSGRRQAVGMRAANNPLDVQPEMISPNWWIAASVIDDREYYFAGDYRGALVVKFRRSQILRWVGNTYEVAFSDICVSHNPEPQTMFDEAIAVTPISTDDPPGVKPNAIGSWQIAQVILDGSTRPKRYGRLAALARLVTAEHLKAGNTFDSDTVRKHIKQGVRDWEAKNPDR